MWTSEKDNLPTANMYGMPDEAFEDTFLNYSDADQDLIFKIICEGNYMGVRFPDTGKNEEFYKSYREIEKLANLTDLQQSRVATFYNSLAREDKDKIHKYMNDDVYVALLKIRADIKKKSKLSGFIQFLLYLIGTAASTISLAVTALTFKLDSVVDKLRFSAVILAVAFTTLGAVSKNLLLMRIVGRCYKKAALGLGLRKHKKMYDENSLFKV